MLIDEIRRVAEVIPTTLEEKRGVYCLAYTVAERKVFLSKKKLTYRARFRIAEDKKELRFTEMLEETGSGLSTGESDIASGFGFKKETYRAGAGPRQGSIEEQSKLLGTRYSYTFDFSTVRRAIEEAAIDAGYAFTYQLTRHGL